VSRLFGLEKVSVICQWLVTRPFAIGSTKPSYVRERSAKPFARKKIGRYGKRALGWKTRCGKRRVRVLEAPLRQFEHGLEIDVERSRTRCTLVLAGVSRERFGARSPRQPPGTLHKDRRLISRSH